jgi:hypothetical protein
MATVAVIDRTMVPAVGYGCRFASLLTGTTRPVVVSPATRVAVNVPWLEVPVVDSRPDEAPFTVRAVLPAANPLTVWLLVSFTVLALVSTRALSRCTRTTVPLTVMVDATVFVVLSMLG